MAPMILGLVPAGSGRQHVIPVATERTVHSDFNGDGFADLAVGVPYEDLGAVVEEGAVNVMYGSGGGLQADSPDDQFWHQDSAGVQDTAERTDHLGAALAAADFNGDGFADLAVGIPNEDFGALEDPGAVGVLYGSAAGLQASAPDDQLWTQDGPDVQDEAEDRDNFGGSLAAGDFNGDGFADLVIGVESETVGSVLNAGAASVLFGSGDGLQATSPDDQIWHQDSPGVEEVAEPEDALAHAVTAGDFNADGFSDLVLGGGEGLVNVLYGSPAGLQTDAPPDQLWSQDSPSVKDEVEGEPFGWTVAAGDFNGDGFADLAVGAYSEAGGNFGAAGAGAVNVLYGAAGGLQARDPDDQIWGQNSPRVKDAAEEDDYFGWALAAADFNADGFADLAVGVLNENFWRGATNVLYGSSAGLQADAPDDQIWSQDSPGVRDLGEGYEYFAIVLAAGDFDADGSDDLVAGVWGETIGVESAVGAVSVLYGSGRGLQAESPDDQFWHQDNPGVQDVAEDSDLFGGQALAAGAGEP
jgi:hypothetical protein